MVAPRLKDPPILEVVCGFFFPALAGLDPILVGKYWAEQKEKHGFPNRQLHGPVVERPGFLVAEGVGPLRSWLVSASEEYVLQIQPDRFYFNWRKREAQYPHFNDYGETKGVLSQSLAEFDQLGAFARDVLGEAPKPVQLQLAKTDLLLCPQHWKDSSDLAALLPVIGTLPRITHEPAVNLALVGERGGFQLHFGLTSTVLSADLSPAIQLETRVTAPATGDDTRKTFEAMNAVVNEVFFEMIASTALERFGQGEP